MIYKNTYRLYCNTEQIYVTVEAASSEAVPSVCPNNEAHEIDSDKTVLVSRTEMINWCDIIDQIIIQCEPETQLPRVLAALDKYPTVIFLTSVCDAVRAMQRLDTALSNGDITQDDYDLIDSILTAN